MKRTLTLLMTAMLFIMAMNAQLLSDQSFKMQRAPYALKSFNRMLTAPARADLADNQLIMGHYDTDDVAGSDEGIGITGLPGVRRLGTILSPSELAAFQGGKIVKFRVGLATSTSISNVLVAPVSATGSIGTVKTWACSVSAVGWNEIVLETPYEINLSSDQSLLIGFDYRQTSSNYPISAVQVGDIYPTYLYYQNQWQNVGMESYGNLSVQCVVESDLFPDYMITLNKLNVNKYIKKGENIPFSFTTRNSGIATDLIEAGACTFDVLVDGQLVTTISNQQSFARNDLNMEAVIASTGLESGAHTLTIVVNSLNGVPVEGPASISSEFIIYQNSFDRQMHLIEELTSNSCMWCPLGGKFIHTVMDMRDDIAMVAIHGNQSAVDPCNTAQCDTLFNYMGGSGWPSAAFDRSVGWEDDKSIASSIGYYEQYHQQVAQELGMFFDYLAEKTPSFATVNISSTMDPETRKAVVTITGDITADFESMMGEDAKLSVFLTEDSLVYRQNNEGTYVADFVHSHVFRQALGSVFGVNINRVDGNKYSNTFEVNIPAAWNADKMEIVAFISRPLANGATGVYTDMFVNQVNKRKFGEFDAPTSLRGDADGDGEVTINDVTVIIDMLLTNSTAIGDAVAADCDFDGEVTINDVTLIIDYLLSGQW